MKEGLERLGAAYAKEVISANVDEDDGLRAGSTIIRAFRDRDVLGGNHGLGIEIERDGDTVQIPARSLEAVMAVVRGIMAGGAQ